MDAGVTDPALNLHVGNFRIDGAEISNRAILSGAATRPRALESG